MKTRNLHQWKKMGKPKRNTYVRLVNATDEAPRMKMCVIFCNAVINIALETASPLGCERQCNSVIRTN